MCWKIFVKKKRKYTKVSLIESSNKNNVLDLLFPVMRFVNVIIANDNCGTITLFDCNFNKMDYLIQPYRCIPDRNRVLRGKYMMKFLG